MNPIEMAKKISKLEQEIDKLWKMIEMLTMHIVEQRRQAHE